MSARRARLRRTRRGQGMIIAARVAAVLVAVVILMASVGAVSAGALVKSWLEDLPDPNAPGAFEVAKATKIYSADGKLLARLYLEDREVIPVSKMSSDLVDAVVAVEDSRFYDHNGVDFIGLGRAVVVNLTEGFGEEGASTITQQYVRNTILLDERTDISVARKVREAYLAIELEKRYTKEQILGMYLNAVYFGEGAYGAQAASRAYFAKNASDLSLPEAALLAGLPQQPSRLSPYDNPDGAIDRRNKVLGDMLRDGYITAEEHDKAVAAKLKLKRAKNPEDGIYGAPYFVAHVKKELQAKFSPAVVFKGGLTVYTTLDTRLQKKAEKAVRNGIGTSASGPEGALVSIDPRTGHVKALVGGRDYHKRKFNLATQGHRQPGSSFKTFVLVAAINEGMPPGFGVDSSSPAYIPTKPKPWVVGNSEGSGRGVISLASATAASVNTVFARVAWEIGSDKVAQMAKRMGIQTKIPALPSISLGAANVTPLEMASAYGTLATGGVLHKPVVIAKVKDSNGEVIFTASKRGKRVLKKEVARASTDVLRRVITGGTARRAQIGRPAAGKTGTSQNYRDVWFVGYTPQLVTAVWVGHLQERPVRVNGRNAFGGTVCAPIWAEFMRGALAGQPALEFPRAGQPKYSPAKFHIPVTKPPSVVGLALANAKSRLGGQSYSISYVWSDKKAGTVVAQGAKGGKLVLYVSKGRKPADRPSITPDPAPDPDPDPEPEPDPDPGIDPTSTPTP